MPMLFVVLFGGPAIFGAFGLFVRRNATVDCALTFSCSIMAAAVFLIVELNSPFAGLLLVSSGDAHVICGSLGK